MMMMMMMMMMILSPQSHVSRIGLFREMTRAAAIPIPAPRRWVRVSSCAGEPTAFGKQPGQYGPHTMVM
jgi:hypothetical protein